MSTCVVGGSGWGLGPTHSFKARHGAFAFGSAASSSHWRIVLPVLSVVREAGEGADDSSATATHIVYSGRSR